MGYKDTEGRNFFRGRYLNADALDTSSAITGTEIAADAAILGTQLSASAAILGTQLSASAAIAGTQLAAGANIAGTQLASNAAIAPTQLAAGVTKVLSGTVAFGDTTKNVIAIPANSLVTDVIAKCTATWNGTSPIVDLGDDSDPNGFIPNATVGLTSGNISGEDTVNRGDLLRVVGAQSGETPFAVSAYMRSTKKLYVAANHVTATVGTTGTPTTGGLTVYLVYVALA